MYLRGHDGFIRPTASGHCLGYGLFHRIDGERSHPAKTGMEGDSADQFPVRFVPGNDAFVGMVRNDLRTAVYRGIRPLDCLRTAGIYRYQDDSRGVHA